MTQPSVWTGKFLASLVLGTALIATGCKQAPAPAPGVRNADGSITNADGSVTYPAGTAPKPATPQPKLNADGSTTNPDGSVTYPAGSTRASQAIKPAAVAQPAPQRTTQAAAPAPAPVAAPVERSTPARASRVIPEGTAIRVATNETLSASRNDVGDSFTGTLAGPIEVEGGNFFERGTRVSGTVVAAKQKGRFKGQGDLAIELTSIGGVRVSTTEYEAASKGKGKRTGALIGGGGGVGALIGGLAGGGKGALIGGLAGAGAGTAASAYTGSRDVVIPSESVITFRLTAPVTLR